MDSNEENNSQKSKEELRRNYWRKLADELERNRANEDEKKKVYEYEIQEKKDNKVDQVNGSGKSQEIGLQKIEDIQSNKEDNYEEFSKEEINNNQKSKKLKKLKKPRKTKKSKETKESKKPFKEREKFRPTNILAKIAYAELVLSIVASIFVWINTIRISRAIPSGFGLSMEPYLLGIGLGFTILGQGIVFFLVILAIKEIADNVYYIKNQKNLK